MTGNVIFKYSLLSFLVFTFMVSSLLKPTPPYKLAQISLEPMLVIDYVNEKKGIPPKITDIKSDTDFLLLKSNNKYSFIHSIKALTALTQRTMIESSDGLYEKLYVGNYDKKNNKMNVHPINQSFIRAINLSPSIKTTGIKLAEIITPANPQNNDDFHMVITDKLFNKSDTTKIKYLL